MNHKVNISVVIPSHNRLEELRRAIQSVMKQSYLPTQIWIIDDGSTEDLSTLKDEFKTIPVFYYRLSEKSNANVARNKGAELSDADYIAFLDSDDEWETNHLLAFYENIDNQSHGYFCGAKIYRQVGTDPMPKLSVSLAEAKTSMDFLLGGGFAQTSGFIVERVTFLQCKFDATLKRHQDFDFFVRFYERYKWKQLSHFTVIIHWEEGRIVNRDYRSEMKFIIRNRSKISPEVYKRYIRNQYDYFYNQKQLAALSIYQEELKYFADLLSFSEYKSFFKEVPLGFWRNTFFVIQYLFFKFRYFKKQSS